MKNFLLGILCGFLLVGLVVVVIGVALVKMGNRPTPVADGSTMVWKLEGDLPERPDVELPFPGLESKSQMTVRDAWSALHRAAEDSRIRALVFEPRGLSIGWAKAQEVRAGLQAFRKSGKPVYAFLRTPGPKELYVSTAADRVYMAPQDLMNVKGMRIEAMYFKNTLDKLGVKAEVEHVGKYKDAFDVFTKTGMSDETRSVLNSVLDSLYGDFCTTVAQGRKKSPDEVRAIVDGGPYMGSEALAKGLVDELAYEDQVYGAMKSRLNKGDLKKVSPREYLKSFDAGEQRTRIALVVGEGEIVRGSNEGGIGPVDNMASTSFAKLLDRVRTDSTIKGVIVRIDSPGGDAVASDDILNAMKELSKAKPTVVSMSDVAASGGYFVAVTGDPILAYSNTLTGSIGVISGKFNLRGLYDKIGITKEVLARGRNATLDSDYTPMTDAERAKMRQNAEATYAGFIARVAAGRKKKAEDIEPLAQGRVWMGSQARQNGLIDEIGGLDRAVDLVRQKAKIASNAKIALVPYPQKRSLLDILLSRADESAVADAAVSNALRRITGTRWVEAWTRPGTLAVMPFVIDVR